MKRAAVAVKVAWLPVIVCGLLACSALQLIPGLLHSECEMTYMYTRPHYQKLNLSQELQRNFPQYSLHLYRETFNREEPTLDWTPLRLRGLPALFIPGNAGSHKQVRSSASIALQMHRREFPKLRHFDFFTVNLNEEFSGSFGGVLYQQTEFVAASIDHILSLYSSSPSPPSSVLIIAHSMGGVVAQALFTLPTFTSSLVSTIVTLSSPLARPVIAFDPTLLQFYTSIAETWYDGGGVAGHVTLVAISGGVSDVQVPPHLTIPPSILPHNTSSSSLTIAASAVPRNWVSADHQAVVWCRRLQLAVTRALFLLQDLSTNQLTSDPHHQQTTFHHLLFTGWKVPISPVHTTMNSELWSLVESVPHYHEGESHSVMALPLSPSLSLSSHLHVATNSDTSHWLFACSLSSSKIANCTDLSPSAKILPPRGRVVKYARVRERDLSGATHIVVSRKRTAAREAKRGKEFVLMERCMEETRDLPLSLWGEQGSTQLHFPPSSLCTLTTFTLPHLKHVWTTHTATIASCPGVKGGLLLPWFPHTPLLHDNDTGLLTVPLSMQVPVPDRAIPELLVWAPPNCTLSLSLSPSFLPLAGKLFVLYTPLLLPWITAVTLSSGPILGELVSLAVIWGATSLGVPPGTDWGQLTSEGLWTAWSPLLIHIVARGLLTILRGLLNLLTFFIHCCLSIRLRQVLAVLLAVVWLPSSMLCGAVGLCSVLAAYTLTVRDKEAVRVQGLLTCLLTLSFPSLCSWLKAIRYSWQLSQDPLFWPIEVTSALSLLFLWVSRTPRSLTASGNCGLVAPLLPVVISSPSSLLSLALLLYSTTHTYRLAYFIAISILISLVTTSLTHTIHRLATQKP